MKRNQWQTVINKFHQSGLTKRAFAHQHNVVYSQLLYWIKQFESVPIETPNDDLIAVKLKTTPEVKLSRGKALGVIEFPNGSRLEIQSPDLLPHLSSLLQS